MSTFILPDDGPCQVAPWGDARVNVRSTPSTGGDLVGNLPPFTGYDVLGRAEMSDGTWYEVSDGWVAGYVTQQGGECGGVPVTYPPSAESEPAAEPADVEDAPPPVEAAAPQLLKYSVDLQDTLSDCPQIAAEAQELPVYVQLDLAAMDNGCDDADAMLADVVFGLAPEIVPGRIRAAMSETCPEKLASLSAYLGDLYHTNSGLWQQVADGLTAENACTVEDDLRQGHLPPELWHGSLETVVQLSAATCLNVDDERVQVLLEKAQAMSLDPGGLAVDCGQIQILNAAGRRRTAEQDLLEDALRECGYTNPLSIEMIRFGSLIYNTDISRLLREADFYAFCAEPLDTIRSYEKFEKPLEDVPQFETCSWIANVLSTYGAELTELELYSILHGPNSCQAGYGYINTGQIPEIGDPLPHCFNPGTGRFEMDGDPVTNLDWNDVHAWEDYVTILNDEDLCEFFPIIINPSDVDWDGIPDEEDLCPGEAGAGLDGCPVAFTRENSALPAGTAANQVLYPQADVRLAPGEVRWLPYAPPEAIGQVVSSLFAANTVDHTVALASLENGQLKLTGVAPGQTMVTLFYTDTNSGETESVVFAVEVAASTPPRIAPVADQTLAVGDIVDLPVHFENADDRLLILTAETGAPEIVLAFVAAAPQVVHEGLVNLMAISPGSGEITISIMEMGDNPHVVSTVTFTVNVVLPGAAAAPAAPQLAAIAEQSLAIQAELRVPITNSGAPFDEIAAVSSNPQVVIAQVVNGEIVLTGVQPGMAVVTLVARANGAASSVMFNVTVTAAAPPPPPQEVVLDPVLLEGDPHALVNILDLPADLRAAAFPDGVSRPVAVFQAEPDSIYVLNGSDPVFLREDAHYAVLDPNGQRVAYLTSDLHLRVLDIAQGVAAPVDDTLPLADYPPAWSPDGTTLYVGLTDGIYVYDLTAPSVAPQLLIPDGQAPSVSPNGRYIAYELDRGDGSAIFVSALANVAESRALLENGAICLMPLFAPNSLNLYFTCKVEDQDVMFRAGIRGVEPIEVGDIAGRHPAPGPIDGYFAFDDGSTIYLASEDLSLVTPLVRMPNIPSSMLRWQASNSPE